MKQLLSFAALILSDEFVRQRKEESTERNYTITDFVSDNYANQAVVLSLPSQNIHPLLPMLYLKELLQQAEAVALAITEDTWIWVKTEVYPEDTILPIQLQHDQASWLFQYVRDSETLPTDTSIVTTYNLTELSTETANILQVFDTDVLPHMPVAYTAQCEGSGSVVGAALWYTLATHRSCVCTFKDNNGHVWNI